MYRVLFQNRHPREFLDNHYCMIQTERCLSFRTSMTLNFPRWPRSSIRIRHFSDSYKQPKSIFCRNSYFIQKTKLPFWVQWRCYLAWLRCIHGAACCKWVSERVWRESMKGGELKCPTVIQHGVVCVYIEWECEIMRASIRQWDC